jgi:hypothetical protein
MKTMTEKSQIFQFWRNFFSDLFLGTFKKLFLFSIAGFAGGAITLFIFKWSMITDLDWETWVKTVVLLSCLLWFGGFGVLHAWFFAVAQIMEKKFIEAVHGLHDLLDLFTREVIGRIPRFSKSTPREEMAKQFDNIGKEFQNKLRLKGITGWISSIIFWIILKALKILFLDNVAEELLKNPSDQITTSDIEHAVRRVGVEIILAPITDTLVLLQIANGILMLLIFSIPFVIFWLI